MDINSIKKLFDIVCERLPYRIFQSIQYSEIIVEEGDGILDAETFDDAGIIIYPNGPDISKNNPVLTAQIISHELWHVFAEKEKFYENINKFLQPDNIEHLLNFLHEVQYGILREPIYAMIEENYINQPYWGKKYFLEMAEENKLLNIEEPILRGAFDELMAEALGRLVTGISLPTPNILVNLISKIK